VHLSNAATDAAGGKHQAAWRKIAAASAFRGSYRSAMLENSTWQFQIARPRPLAELGLWIRTCPALERL